MEIINESGPITVSSITFARPRLGVQRSGLIINLTLDVSRDLVLEDASSIVLDQYYPQLYYDQYYPQLYYGLLHNFYFVTTFVGTFSNVPVQLYFYFLL